jgi:hypothetical protein
MRYICTSIVATLMLAGTSTADLYVGEGESIQAAINSVEYQGLETIHIAAGVYYEHLIINARYIRLIGSINQDGVPATVIDGWSGGRILQYTQLNNPNESHACGAENIIFRNGSATSGAAIYLGSVNVRGVIYITNCHFMNNAASVGGAGVFIGSPWKVTISDSLFWGNRTNFVDPSGGGSGSAVLSNGQYSGNPSYPTYCGIDNCVIANNWDPSPYVGAAVEGFPAAQYLSIGNTLFCANSGICDDGNVCGPWSDLGNEFYDSCPGGLNDCNDNDVPDHEDISSGTSYDCNANLIPDECEVDCDGDGLIDDCDSDPDLDGNGVPDNCDPDCNENGIADGVEILLGWADDCDGDGVPDSCQIADGSEPDCNGDGVLDTCEISPETDCNGDSVLDECQLNAETDCDASGVLDVCELDGTTDCNADGTLDSCQSGKIDDCDADGIFDVCAINEDPSLDCDLDGMLDVCAIDDGLVEDCNNNLIPDSCDFANGGDKDGDGTLDDCECTEDISGPGGPGVPDGVVDVNDALAVIGYWGQDQPAGDVDDDGIVGVNDLLLVLAAWGPCP